MFQLAVIYTDSGKRYTIPFDILKKVLTDKQIENIKIEALKEVNKL